ncbi:stage V sporulation protein D [Clostridia bacterium]|nr:stage V sporulation protein D [Clostridia bacterium]
MGFTKINSTKARINFVIFVLLFICFGGLILRLAYFQIVKHESYKKMVEKQYMRITHPKPKRGSISDRNGIRLAESALVWDVAIAPGKIEDEQKKRIAADLTDLLDEDKEKIKEILKRKSQYAVLKRSIEKDLADKVRTYAEENNVPINLEPSSKRYYIRKDFLATVLGFVGQDGQGLEGLEKFYEDELKGSDGKIIASANARGTNMPDSTQKEYHAENGKSLILTIDAKIQEILERHLKDAVVERFVANRAAGIIMDANTGEILAMATKPDFDPNKPYEIVDEKKKEEIAKIKNPKEREKEMLNAAFAQWRNKVVCDPYEPGSVFKVITAASALEEGKIGVNDHFHCSGHIKVDDRPIRCWVWPDKSGHGSLSFDDALILSCNPSFAQIGLRLGQKNFMKYFEAFGFTEKTGIDFPGEALGSFYDEETFRDHALAVSSIGQTFKATALQLLAGVTAAVNNGKLVKPYIVKQIIDEHGNVIKSNSTIIKRQVVSSEVSKRIAQDCEKVVAGGAGRRAGVPGYRIGGKTGTAQKVGEQKPGEDEKYVLSFWGFTPVEAPEISILVLLDEPRDGGETWGAVLAAPVAGKILAEVLPYLKMEPTDTKGGTAKPVSVTVPSLEGESVSKAKEILKKLKFKYRVSGEKEVVTGQMPTAQVRVPSGSTITLYTEAKNEINKVEVPNLIGKSVKEATEILNNKGLNVMIKSPQEMKSEKGKIIVVVQDPVAGEKVDPGKVVELEIMPSADANVR